MNSREVKMRVRAEGYRNGCSNADYKSTTLKQMSNVVYVR
jgi:hypothetical protein